MNTQDGLSAVEEKENSLEPIPVLQYSSSDFIIELPSLNTAAEENGSKKDTFKSLLRERWQTAKTENAFNYNLECVYRKIEGKFNMDMQLNVARGVLRRKPMRFQEIKEPFDPSLWNFTKLQKKEILFHLESKDVSDLHNSSERNIVAVNASPLERDHSLIIPTVDKCSPQVLTPAAIGLAVDVMLLVDDSDFKVLFNSLLGQASVNHLHLHCLYWPHETDLVNRKFKRLGSSEIYVIEPPNWLCHAFAFQLKSSEQYEKFKKNLTSCITMLSDEGQAHNIFMTRASKIRTHEEGLEDDLNNADSKFVTAYVFPRTNMIGAKPATNFNPAALELAGCLTAYNDEFYKTADESMCVNIIRNEAVLPVETFQKILMNMHNLSSTVF